MAVPEVSTSAAKRILLDRVPMSGHRLAPPGPFPPAIDHRPVVGEPLLLRTAAFTCEATLASSCATVARALLAPFCTDEDDVEVRCMIAFSTAIGGHLIAAEHRGRSRQDMRALISRRLFSH